MALTVFYTPRWRAIDANGNPMSGAILKFYEAGLVTPAPVYADVNGSTPLGVTVTADGGGLFAEIFMAAHAYGVELYTSANVLVWSADNFLPPQPASASSVALLAVAGITFAAGETAYMSDGSGALNAGQMYKGDADLDYASFTPMVYMTTDAINVGETGLFISEGVVTGLSGLTPGAAYYLSGTAGQLSATPGVFTRRVGQARTTTELAFASNPPVLVDVDPRIKTLFNGRLTLTSGTPVTTADVTGAGTLYLALYQGNQFGLYTGSRWVVTTLAQLSIAVPAVANQVYDAFLDWNDGSPTLVLTAWTNDTTRATALTTQDGIYVKTGDTQQRYVGTVRTMTAGQLNDAVLYRHVWNYYNRAQRLFLRQETTANWNYTTATIRQANGNTANQVDWVQGVSEDPVSLFLNVRALNSGGDNFSAGLGIDSTNTFASVNWSNGTAASMALPSQWVGFPGIGRHFGSWNEFSIAAGTTTWYATNGVVAASASSGISGWIWG